jgi:hypothetical protein
MGSALVGDEPAAHFVSIHPRHHEVDEHDIGLDALHRLQAARPIGRGLDDPRGAELERELDDASHVGVVLDEHDAHAGHCNLLWFDAGWL